MKRLQVHLPQNRANRKQNVNTAVTPSQGSCCTMDPRVREDDKRRDELNEVSSKTLTETRNHQCKAMWQLLKRVRYFMDNISPFPGGGHGRQKSEA